MNAETKRILSQYLFDKAVEEELDEQDWMDSLDEMEDNVWGVFRDWADGDWESAEIKLLRIRHAKEKTQ